MEKVSTFFFDTYALYEIILGNRNYDKYVSNVSIVTTKLNLMELHYGLMRIENKEIADFYYDKYLEFTVEVDDDIIKTANVYRLEKKKSDVSYVDCIGYMIAKNLGIKFLTGDKEFESVENVEFVK